MGYDKKKKKSCFEILFYIYLIGGVLFIFLGPKPQKVGGRGYDPGRQKSCYSNIRILQGAVEMYNMDVATMMTSLDQSALINDHYIKDSSPLVCPNDSKHGVYKNSGDLTDSGEIYCTYHGGLIMEGEFDKELRGGHRLFEFDFNILDCFKRIPYAFFWPLFARPNGLTTYCK